MKIQTVSIDLVKLHSRSRYEYKKYYTAMRQLWKEGIRVFIDVAVDTMADSRNPTIDTGMSAGSLIPLAREVRGTTISTRQFILSNRQHISRRGYGYDPHGFRSIGAGEALGEDAYSTSYGTVDEPIFSFSFDINVFQYQIHEDSWKSLDKAEDEMLRFITSEYERYVPASFFDSFDIENYITYE